MQVAYTCHVQECLDNRALGSLRPGVGCTGFDQPIDVVTDDDVRPCRNTMHFIGDLGWIVISQHICELFLHMRNRIRFVVSWGVSL